MSEANLDVNRRVGEDNENCGSENGLFLIAWVPFQRH